MLSSNLLGATPALSFINNTAPNTAATTADGSSKPDVVTSWNIFWVLLTLSLSCITHPIGSACGFPPEYRHSVRANPLASLFDTGHFLYEIFNQCRSYPSKNLPEVIGLVVAQRLEHNIPSERMDQLPQAATSKLDASFLDLRVRAIVTLLCILQYAKLCGYTGLPFLFSVSTMLFVAWIVMEGFYFVGCLDLRSPRPDLSAAPSEGGLRILVPPIPRRSGVWLICLPVVALLIGLIVYTVGRPTPVSTSPAPPPPEDTVPIGHRVLKMLMLYAFLVLGSRDWVLDILVDWSELVLNFSIGEKPGLFRIIVCLPLSLLLILVSAAVIAIPLAIYLILMILGPVCGLVSLYYLLRFRNVLYTKFIRAVRRMYRRVMVLLHRHSLNLARLAAVGLGVGVIMYCLRMYEPEGTSKADWTEKLP